MTPVSERADRLFVRYRDRSDVDALGELFDLLAPELRRLAMRWSPDRDAAEDLVQATFLTALRRADRYDPSRPVTPWLVGLLGVHAARARRAAARRPDPERLERRDEPDPADLAVDGELRHEVDRAVDQLPERYRRVVRGALLDGRPPRVLARELGREPGTIRVQLHRGLALLRGALPAGLTSALALVVSPRRAAAEVATRRAVLAAARTATGVGPKSLILGGLLVNKFVIPLAVVALLTAGYQLVSPGADVAGESSEGPDPALDGAPTLQVAEAPGGANARPTNPRPSAPADAREVERSPAKSEISSDGSALASLLFEGRVVGLREEAFGRARVQLELFAGEEPLGEGRFTGLSVEAGEPRFEFRVERPDEPLGSDPIRPDSALFTLHDALHRSEQVRIALVEEGLSEDAAQEPVELVARPIGGVSMRLVDEFGDPLPNHFVAVYAFPEDAERPEGEPLVHGRSDEAGLLAVSIETDGRVALVSPAWKRRPATRVVDGTVGRMVELGDVVLDRGEIIAGRAWRGAEFQPAGTLVVGRLQGAEDNYRVYVGNQLLQMDWIDGRFEHIHCANLIEGDDGAFRIMGATNGRYSVEVYVSAGEGPPPVEVVASRFDLELHDATGRVRLVTPPGHRSQTVARVLVTPEEGDPFELDWIPGRGVGGQLALAPGSRATVRVTVQGDEGTEVELDVDAPEAGASIEVEVPLGGGPVGGLRIVDGPAAPELEGVEFLVELRSGDDLARSGRGRFKRGEDGVVAIDFPDLPTGAYEIALNPINAVRPPCFLPDLESTVVEGERVDVLVEVEPAGVLPIVIDGHEGRPISGRVATSLDQRLEVDTVWGGVRRFRSEGGAVQGAYESELLLPAGRQTLTVSAKGHLSRTVEVEIEAGVVAERLRVRLERDADAEG